MIRPARPFLPWVLAVTLTVGSGAVAGNLGSRWGAPAALSMEAARLSKVPAEFGDWSLQSDIELEAGVVKMLQCAGSINRSYRNRRTGDTVHMAMFLGPPGPMSVHTPEVCFSSQGYYVESAAERSSFRVPGKPEAQVWKTTFAPDAPGPEKLVAYYGWYDGSSWSAPNHARLAYGGKPFLFKLQLAAKVVTQPSSETQRAPGDDFLAQFWPALQSAGFYEPGLVKAGP